MSVIEYLGTVIAFQDVCMHGPCPTMANRVWTFILYYQRQISTELDSHVLKRFKKKKINYRTFFKKKKKSFYILSLLTKH